MELRKNSKRGNTTIVLIVITLILAGVAIFLFLNYFPKKTSQQPVETQTETQSGTRNAQNNQPTESEGEPLPEKDAIGTRDLEVVSRYPGSVRVGYSNDEQMERTSVDYETKAEKDEVKTYYVSTLEDKGWKIETSKEDRIRFGKDEATLFVNFHYDESDKILDYYLEYYPTSKY